MNERAPSVTHQPRRKLEASSWIAVVRAYQECTRRYTRLLAGLDLTIPQFDVLTTVDQLGDEAMPKAIAERLLVTRGNITGLLQRLQNKGLLTSRLNEHDGRSVLCSLTADGREALDRAHSVAARFIEQQLLPFDRAELERTERVMNRMRSHLQTMDVDAILAQLAEDGTLSKDT